MLERAAQVRHGEALVDREALDLVEHRACGSASSSSVRNTLPGRDDVDRQLALEQRADLHRRRVRAQHEVRVDRVDEEGVLHGAGRVVLVEVQRVEVEPLVLELGPFGDLPPHADEDVADPLHAAGSADAGRRASPGAAGPPSRRRLPAFSCSASSAAVSSASRAVSAAPTRPRAAPRSLPAAGFWSAGRLRIAALRLASTDASPACSARTFLSVVGVGRRGDRGQRRIHRRRYCWFGDGGL